MNFKLKTVLKFVHKGVKSRNWVFVNEKTGGRYNRIPKFMKSLCKCVFDPDCKSLKKYKGPVYGFHDLRHFMASFIASKGKGSIKDFQRLLRHNEVRTTEIYLHNMGDNLRTLVQDAEVFKIGVPFKMRKEAR